MSDEYDDPADRQRPGPYQGPGGYGFGQRPGPGAGPGPVPGPRPTQVTAASWITGVLGGLTALLLLMLPTSAGAEIAETLTGKPDAKAVVGFAALVGAAGYLIPAIYLRRRRNWARIMTIVVAALGIAGGVMSLPGGILGLAVHATLLAMMVQQPTKDWFAAHR